MKLPKQTIGIVLINNCILAGAAELLHRTDILFVKFRRLEHLWRNLCEMKVTLRVGW